MLKIVKAVSRFYSPEFLKLLPFELWLHIEHFIDMDMQEKQEKLINCYPRLLTPYFIDGESEAYEYIHTFEKGNFLLSYRCSQCYAILETSFILVYTTFIDDVVTFASTTTTEFILFYPFVEKRNYVRQRSGNYRINGFNFDYEDGYNFLI